MKEFSLPREKTASDEQHKLKFIRLQTSLLLLRWYVSNDDSQQSKKSMCLKIHKIPTVLFIDENTASKEFSFTDFFSKNSNRINDQGAIMEILHVLDKCAVIGQQFLKLSLHVKAYLV